MCPMSLIRIAFRPISSLPSLEPPLACLSQTESLRLAHGKVFGSWNFEMDDRGGKFWQRCRELNSREAGDKSRLRLSFE